VVPLKAVQQLMRQPIYYGRANARRLDEGLQALHIQDAVRTHYIHSQVGLSCACLPCICTDVHMWLSVDLVGKVEESQASISSPPLYDFSAHVYTAHVAAT